MKRIIPVQTNLQFGYPPLVQTNLQFGSPPRSDEFAIRFSPSFRRICNSAAMSISICDALKHFGLQILILTASELQIHSNRDALKHFGLQILILTASELQIHSNTDILHPICHPPSKMPEAKDGFPQTFRWEIGYQPDISLQAKNVSPNGSICITRVFFD